MPHTILVIDDEPQIRKFLRISLTANGYLVSEAENARAGLSQIARTPQDLLILDLGLPDLDGQEVITQIRQSSAVPILVLSVRSQETDKIEALDRGANDYVVKPFSTGELMARVRALLRSGCAQDQSERITIGGLTLDLVRRKVIYDGDEIHLTRKEWELLLFLARHADHVLTHRTILKAVWGAAHVEDTAYLRVYINQLRQKIERNPAVPDMIITDPGVGYRLQRGE